jgi:class 3 adenylate cyclase
VIEVELPTGTVTLLFTDIEGSTRLLRSLGDDDGTVLRAHRAILRAAVGRHGGVEFGTEGTPAMTSVQGLDYAAGWADQRGRGPT